MESDSVFKHGILFIEKKYELTYCIKDHRPVNACGTQPP